MPTIELPRRELSGDFLITRGTAEMFASALETSVPHTHPDSWAASRQREQGCYCLDLGASRCEPPIEGEAKTHPLLWEPLSLSLHSSELVFAQSARPGVTDRCCGLGRSLCGEFRCRDRRGFHSHLHWDRSEEAGAALCGGTLSRIAEASLIPLPAEPARSACRPGRLVSGRESFHFFTAGNLCCEDDSYHYDFLG